MRDFFKLLRVKHYIKNILILLPLFCSGQLFNAYKLKNAFIGVLAFALMTSVVYIINDIKDKDNDNKSIKKANRPIASRKNIY